MAEASLSGEVIAPRVIILPVNPSITSGGSTNTGVLIVSGAKLLLGSGSTWITFSGSNMGADA